MAKVKPIPRILFVCSQNALGEISSQAIEVLGHLITLLQPLQDQGQLEIWVEEPDSRIYLEDILSQRPAKQYLTIIHVIGPLVDGKIKVRSRNGDGLIDSQDQVWTRTEWPFLRTIAFSGSQPTEWMQNLPKRGIPMVLSTGIDLASAVEPYLHLMSGSPMVEAGQLFIGDEKLIFPLKGEGGSASWAQGSPQDVPKGLAYAEVKLRALAWRLRNPLLIPSSEKQWLLQQIRHRQKVSSDLATDKSVKDIPVPLPPTRPTPPTPASPAEAPAEAASAQVASVEELFISAPEPIAPTPVSVLQEQLSEEVADATAASVSEDRVAIEEVPQQEEGRKTEDTESATPAFAPTEELEAAPIEESTDVAALQEEFAVPTAEKPSEILTSQPEPVEEEEKRSPVVEESEATATEAQEASKKDPISDPVTITPAAASAENEPPIEPVDPARDDMEEPSVQETTAPIIAPLFPDLVYPPVKPGPISLKARKSPLQRNPESSHAGPLPLPRRRGPMESEIPRAGVVPPPIESPADPSPSKPIPKDPVAKSPTAPVKKQPQPSQRPGKKSLPAEPVTETIPSEAPGEAPNGKLPTPAQRTKPAKSNSKPSPLSEKPVKIKEKRPRSPLRTWLLVGGVILLGGLISLGVWMPSAFTVLGLGVERPENPCPFPAKTSDYRVLVLSFLEEGECRPSRLIHEPVLMDQIKAFRQKGLHVDVRLLEVEDCEDRMEKSKGIASSCGADLLLWAKYEGEATKESQAKLYYYIAESKYARLLMPQQTFEEVVTLGPKAVKGQNDLLFVSNMLYWYEALKEQEAGNSAEASRYLEAMSMGELVEESNRVQFLRNAYLSIGEYHRAQRLYDELILSHPELASAYQGRADVFRKMGRWDASLEDLTRALKLAPDDLELLLSRGMVHVESGNPAKGIEDYSQALNIHGDLALIYVSRADAHVAAKSYGLAERDYNKALTLTPNYPNAYYRRAQLYRIMGRETLAISDIEQALTLEPGMQGALLFDVEGKLARRAYDEALTELNKLIQTHPKMAQAWYQRGCLYNEVNKSRMAIDDFTQALIAVPTHLAARFERGKVHFSNRDFERAVKDFTRLLDLRPFDALAYAWKGRSLAAQGMHEAALVDFQKAREMDPKMVEPILFQAETNFLIGNLDKALADVNQLLMTQASSPEIYVLRGRIQSARNQYPAAKADFDRAIRMEIGFVQAYVYRGVTSLALGQKAAAMADFDEAIQRGTRDALAYRERAQLHLDNREFEPVLALYAQAIKLDSTSVETYIDRGRYYQRFNRHDQALQDFERAIQLGGTLTPEIYLLRGKSHAALQHENEALIDFTRVIRNWPDSADAYCARGMLYQQMGKLSQAQEDLEFARKIDPTNAKIFFSQGVLFQGMNNVEKALELFDRAIALDPRYASAYNRRGELFSEMEAYEEALTDFSKALELDPGLGRAYRNRGNIARKASEYEDAIRDYSQAVLYDPTDADAFYSRGFLYAMKQRYDQAIPDIRRSLELDSSDGLRYGFLAKIYARQGKDLLFYENIEIALAKKYPLSELENDPAFKPYRDQDRFKKLLARYTR